MKVMNDCWGVSSSSISSSKSSFASKRAKVRHDHLVLDTYLRGLGYPFTHFRPTLCRLARVLDGRWDTYIQPMQRCRVVHLGVCQLREHGSDISLDVALTLKRFMKLSTPPISSPTSFIKLLYCASNLIHAGAYLSPGQLFPRLMTDMQSRTYSLPVTESRTYALSRYSKLTIIEYSVARFSVRSRSAEVVYSRASSSRFIMSPG